MRTFMMGSGFPYPGIRLASLQRGPAMGLPAVRVGEEGRGRWAEAVLPDRREAVSALAIGEEVLDAGVAWTPGRGATLVDPSPGDRALVLVVGTHGYRGGSTLYALSALGGVPYAPPGAPGRPEWEGAREGANLPGWAALDTACAAKRAARPAAIGGVTVVASGRHADGDAGNMASSFGYLLIVEPGEGLVLTRSGRLYGGPVAQAWRWDGAEWDTYDILARATGPKVRL